MSVVRFACVVEGHGEVEAVPVLLKRIVRTYRGSCYADVGKPIRKYRSLLLKEGELEKSVQIAALAVNRRGAILVLLDGDDDPTCVLAPRLLARAQSAAMGCPVGVVLARREYESWFLAAIESLASFRGLGDELEPPPRHAEIRGAKEWLCRLMPAGQPYKEARHQADFSGRFDLRLARERAPSFDKLCREIERLCDELSGGVE